MGLLTTHSGLWEPVSSFDIALVPFPVRHEPTSSETPPRISRIAAALEPSAINGGQQSGLLLVWHQQHRC